MATKFTVNITAFDVDDPKNHHPNFPPPQKYGNRNAVLVRSVGADAPAYAKEGVIEWADADRVPFKATVTFAHPVSPHNHLQVVFGAVSAASRSDPTQRESPAWAATYGQFSAPVNAMAHAPCTACARSSSGVSTPWQVTAAVVGKMVAFAASPGPQYAGPPWANNNAPPHPSVVALAQTFEAAANSVEHRVAPDGTDDKALRELFAAAMSPQELITSTLCPPPPTHNAASLDSVVKQVYAATGWAPGTLERHWKRVSRAMNAAVGGGGEPDDADRGAANDMRVAMSLACLPSSWNYVGDTAFAAAIHPTQKRMCLAVTPSEESYNMPPHIDGRDCENSGMDVVGRWMAVQNAGAVARTPDAKALVECSNAFEVALATAVAAGASASAGGHEETKHRRAEKAGKFTMGFDDSSKYDNFNGHVLGIARPSRALAALFKNDSGGVFLEGTAPGHGTDNHPLPKGTKAALWGVVAMYNAMRDDDKGGKARLGAALNSMQIMAVPSFPQRPCVDANDPEGANDHSFVRRLYMAVRPRKGHTAELCFAGTVGDQNQDFTAGATPYEFMTGKSADGRRRFAISAIRTDEPIDPNLVGPDALALSAAMPPTSLAIADGARASMPAVPAWMQAAERTYTTGSKAEIAAANTVVFFPTADPAANANNGAAFATLAKGIEGRVVAFAATMIPRPMGTALLVGRFSVAPQSVPRPLAAALSLGAKMHPDAHQHVQAIHDAMRAIDAIARAVPVATAPRTVAKRAEAAEATLHLLVGPSSFTPFGEDRPTVAKASIEEWIPPSARQRAMAGGAGAGPHVFPWFGTQLPREPTFAKAHAPAQAQRTAPRPSSASKASRRTTAPPARTLEEFFDSL